jgi:hypothetical protein
MHDRAARPTGAVKSAAAMAIETMILLNIDFPIARVRPNVEEKRSASSRVTRVLALLGLGDHVTIMSTRCFRLLFATQAM